MSLPWHVPLEKAPCLKKEPKYIQPSLLKHYCHLKVHERPMEELQTGLMVDVGMENGDTALIQRLLACGMTIARLDLFGLEPDVSAQLIQSLRQAVYNYSANLNYIYPLALMVNVKGPDIVTGDLKDSTVAVELLQNSTIRLSNDVSWRDSGTAYNIYVSYYYLTELVPGDVIYINSIKSGEKIQLSVLNVGDDSIECRVILGGFIGSKMPVKIPKTPILREAKDGGDSVSSISCSENSQKCFEHIDDQIAWAVASDVDAILVPCAQTSSDVRQVKNILSLNGKHILVFASIDSVRGLDNIDDILKEADGIFLDRNELGTDLPIEKTFIAQKMILAKCNEIGKPCICKAVLNEQIPTLCVSDIANLVIDGADVISLEFHFNCPLKHKTPNYEPYRMAEHCLAAASVICREAEKILWQPKIYGNLDLMKSPINEPSRAVCLCAVELAMRSRATVIVCLTSSGRTAKILAHAKPPCPIVAVTRTCYAGRQLRFWRGVRAIHYFDIAKNNWNIETETRILAAVDYCKAKHILRAGDPYVVITGTHRGAGYCDSVKLFYASARNTVVVE